MYGDLLEDLRDGLAVTSEHDDRLLRGVQNAARSLLRTYNFRNALTLGIIPIAAGATGITLPAGVGKVKAVVLTVVEGGSKLVKRLRRREEGVFPYYGGPVFYEIVGQTLRFDQPMPGDAFGYNVELYYQTTSITAAEPWLSDEFKDVLEHRAGVELALKLRKMEAHQLYSAMWQEDVAVLGRFIPEVEFNDLDMSMGESVRGVMLERYPAT